MDKSPEAQKSVEEIHYCKKGLQETITKYPNSVSSDTLNEFAKHLSQVDKIIAGAILSTKEDVVENAELRELVSEYLDASLHTLEFLNVLEDCLRDLETSHLLVSIAVKNYTEKKIDECKKRLKKFIANGDPFQDKFYPMFKKLRERQEALLKKAEKTFDELNEKRKKAEVEEAARAAAAQAAHVQAAEAYAKVAQAHAEVAKAHDEAVKAHAEAVKAHDEAIKARDQAVKDHEAAAAAAAAARKPSPWGDLLHIVASGAAVIAGACAVIALCFPLDGLVAVGFAGIAAAAELARRFTAKAEKEAAAEAEAEEEAKAVEEADAKAMEKAKAEEEKEAEATMQEMEEKEKQAEKEEAKAKAEDERLKTEEEEVNTKTTTSAAKFEAEKLIRKFFFATTECVIQTFESIKQLADHLTKEITALENIAVEVVEETDEFALSFTIDDVNSQAKNFQADINKLTVNARECKELIETNRAENFWIQREDHVSPSNLLQI